MSGGVFAVDRRIFDHKIFADEPFTERLAWLWLVGEAAWKPKRVRTAHGMVALERGQLAHSQRFLAEKWKWDRSRVRRFLDLLVSEKMLTQSRPSFDPAKQPASTQQTNQLSYILTICNYDKYQFGSPSNEPSSDEKTTQRTNEKRPKEEERINKKEEIVVGGADAPVPDNVVPIQIPISRQYAFEGRVIKLTSADLDRWRKTYSAIIDIVATLQAADDYYSDNPPKDGKWFFPVSRWLDKEHKATLERAAISRKEELRRRGDAW